MNHYKEMGRKLFRKGIVSLPGKYASKSALLKGWTEYFDKKPTIDEISKWESLESANLEILLGKCSNLVALDIDTDRPEIMDIIKPLLPESPVIKKGSKGYTSFFRYCGDSTEQLKYNGEVLLEILSDGKKTTFGTHPNGADYVYTSEKTLLDVNTADLPVLPPSLISTLELKLKQTLGGQTQSSDYGKLVNGRNSALSSHLGVITSYPHSIEQAINDLIAYDKANHEVPYFTDLEEHNHGEAYTNALLFYSSHMNSFNSKRHRTNDEYIVPIRQVEVSEVKKNQVLVEKIKNSKAHEFIPANTAIKTISEIINANSWVKQPELSLAAILALGATLASRKFMFQGMTTNLYVCTVAPSGSGKNMGMEFVKSTLINLKLERFLGAGDMASDAGITDNLVNEPTKLFPMDEIGGILKTMTSGKAEYNSKMGDILTELYTCSTGRYLGRVLSEGVKGAIDRPHLSILGATTPTGFRQGVNRAALEKGLLGRFLVFFGDADVPSTRVKNVKPLPPEILNQLSYLASYKPDESELTIQGREQFVTELQATPEADKRLDEIFTILDQVRLENQHDTIAPIAARLYQQMIKIVIISACLNSNRQLPKISLTDVEFGYNVIMAQFNNFKSHVDTLIYDTPLEKTKADIINIIKQKEGLCSRSELIKKTKGLTAHLRDGIINELVDSNQIDIIRVNVKDKWQQYYQIIQGGQ